MTSAFLCLGDGGAHDCFWRTACVEPYSANVHKVLGAIIPKLPSNDGSEPSVTIFCDAANVSFVATGAGKVECQISIREAHAADFTQWRVLWDQYNAFYGRSGATALSDEIVLSSWQRFLEPKEPLICLVAEQGDRLVGLAHFIVHRNTITIENTAYLQDLFSDPSLRGKGIGRALIASFFEHACDAGIAQVYWHTHASNQTAMRLYDRVATNTGFTVYRKTLAI